VAPTAPEIEVQGLLHGRLMTELARWRAVVQSDLPALNTLLHTQGVPQIGGFAAP
jgi:tagatose-1,6-bisphosphate aldolase